MDMQRQEDVLKAIADGTRLRILGLIAERPRSGAELAHALNVTAPTVSHHMARLAAVGLVEVDRDGARRLYRLNDALLREVGGLNQSGGPDAGAVADAAATSVDITAGGSGAGATGPRLDDDPEHARHIRIFFDGPRLRQIPAKRKARVSVLLHLLRGFEPGRDYTERDLNAILAEAHDDVATLRRELIDYRYLTRNAGIYRVADAPPQRDANEQQEVPSGEAAWLGALLRQVREG